VSVYAKNLEQRFGAGVSFHDFQKTPALSLRYAASPYFFSDFLAGFDSDDRVNLALLGVKIARHVILEENMNLYLGLGAFYLSAKPEGSTRLQSGLEFDALLGAEFFLAGIPNLGFVLETGIGLRNLDKMTVRTLGSGFLGAGMHYYF